MLRAWRTGGFDDPDSDHQQQQQQIELMAGFSCLCFFSSKGRTSKLCPTWQLDLFGEMCGADLPAYACAVCSLLLPRHSESASARWMALSQEPCQRHQVRPRSELCGVALPTSIRRSRQHICRGHLQHLPQRSSVHCSAQTACARLGCPCEHLCELAPWPVSPVQARVGTNSWSR
jgi:hypothetical protein